MKYQSQLDPKLLREEILRLADEQSSQHENQSRLIEAITDHLANCGWPDNFETERETAARTGCPITTIKDLRARGEFPPSIKLSPNGRRVANRSLSVTVWQTLLIAAARQKSAA